MLKTRCSENRGPLNWTNQIGGGIAATIGNAHAVEDMIIGHSIVVGNTVHEINGAGPVGYTIGSVYQHDIFTGSVFDFRSMGYNRIGVIDFSQILVPVGEPGWASCRASTIRKWMMRMAWFLVMFSARDAVYCQFLRR